MRNAAQEVETRKSNLLSAIEAGASGQALGTLIQRLKELEAEGDVIGKKLREIDTPETPPLDLRDAGVAVADFILNFQKRFEEMSPEDRKAQVKRCVSRIVVDKERGIATAYIRRIPAALPAIEELYHKQKPPTTKVVSGRSSGDRT